MVTKTWFHFLPDAGRPITMKADDLLIDINKKKGLLKQLRQLEEEIAQQEAELLAEVQADWSIQEIEDAKKRRFSEHLGID